MSRELDADVAREVMEWTINDGLWYPPYAKLVASKLPAYSIDIAAAWLVVEKMKTRGYTWTLFVYGIGAQARIESGGSVVALVEYDTAPLAICRAALAAVREVEG